MNRCSRLFLCVIALMTLPFLSIGCGVGSSSNTQLPASGLAFLSSPPTQGSEGTVYTYTMQANVQGTAFALTSSPSGTVLSDNTITWTPTSQQSRTMNQFTVTATYAPVGSAYVVPSAVSKAGVEALTRSLAVEWGNRGIRMNAIAPGPIPTQGAFSRVLPRPDLETLALERNPLHRFGTVEELANLAAFLVSDGSSYINGEVIRMDGGEFLQGAGEFSNLGRVLTEPDWQAMKPKKRSPP